MTQEQNEKYKRLNDRLNELFQVNENIGRLAFYMQNNELDKEADEEMHMQLVAMQIYSDTLLRRIIKGIY